MRTLGTIIAALGIAMGLSMSISPSPASFAADAAYEKPYVKEGTYTDKALIPVTGLGPLAQTWNFGSSVLGSSVSNESRTTFTEDTWLLKAAMKIATIPPLSWIFKDTSQTQSFMRGLFGAYWSDEDHAEQCPWYNDPNITESDVDGTIIERCHQGYVGTLSTGNGLPSRLGVLSSAIGSSN